MNLESINSVNDLIEANKAPNYHERIDEILAEAVEVEGLKAAMSVAIAIISRIEDFHDTVSDNLLEENNQDEALAWAHDGSKLCIVQGILKSIDLG